ncbi:MAG TPA: MFS transporter, partial [Nitrolancea sp.]|nr:MFS transporter [Nitrolancea sp.]
TMLSLALPLVVVGQTGSYVAAGLTTASYAIAAGIGGPLLGRLVDRIGARVVLGVTGGGQGLALLSIVLAAATTSSAIWLAVGAAFAGFFNPPVSPVMRVLWSRQTRRELRDAAFAFESITIDVLYILGPSLVALLIAVSPLNTTLIVAAACSASGAGLLALAAGPGGARQAARSIHWLGPLRSKAVRRMLPIAALLAGSLTVVDLSVIAFTTAHQAKAFAGIVIAAMSVGSVAGGIYWGSRPQPGTLRRQLSLLLGAMTAGMIFLSLAPTVLLVGSLSIVVGLALAPSITTEYSLMDTVAPPREITEAFSWLGTAGQVGAAGAVAIAGPFVTRLHHSGGFVVATVMIGAAALYCALLAPEAIQHIDG